MTLQRQRRTEAVAAICRRWQRRYRRLGLLGKRWKPKRMKGAAIDA
jgi:hypothetical protein